MSSSSSARLGLSYLAAGQLQKHVTVNEALTRLDALTQLAVVSRTVSVQPADPDDGDLYILPAGATGSVWSTWSEGDLARAEFGGWTRVAVPVGVLALVRDTGVLMAREAGGGWGPVSLAGGSVSRLSRLGVGTDADAVNPVAARINKALWTAVPTGEGGDGDLRFTFNKQGPSDVLSLLFQSGFSARAELGLVGDDDLTLKVSGDGSAWHEALRVDGDVGRVWFARGAARAETVQLTAGGDWTPPDWARVLTVVALGGGGAGGQGAFGAGGARSGGGGGGAGGLSTATWRAEDLPGLLSVTIGAGGSAGGAGGDTVVTRGGVTLLTARGGGAGQSGASGGAGGVRGQGTAGGNAGGATSTSATAAAGEASTCPAGPGGGGGGGGLDGAGVARSGGAGGIGGPLTAPGAGGSGGTSAEGGAGSVAPSSVSASGGGGGGGGAAPSGAGFAGGAGAAFGAGGGGGGAGVSAGGAGGSGASGVVLILVQG